MKYRDLEAVRQLILEATGLDVSYYYEDLVFPEETVFIIQFDDHNLNNLFCHFQKDLKNQARENVYKALAEVCQKQNISLEMKGLFELKEKDEKIDLVFLPLA